MLARFLPRSVLAALPLARPRAPRLPAAPRWSPQQHPPYRRLAATAPRAAPLSPSPPARGDCFRAAFSTAGAPVDYTALPRGWTRWVDEKTGLPYYENTETNETTWERPHGHCSSSAPPRQTKKTKPAAALDRAKATATTRAAATTTTTTTTPTTPISNVCLYVGNLPESYRADDLEREFSKFGRLSDFFLSRKDGQHRGFGFVEFETPDAAERAAKSMDGISMPAADGRRPMSVVFAREREVKGTTKNLPRHQRLERKLERLLGMAALAGDDTNTYHEQAFQAYKSFRDYYYAPESGWQRSKSADRLICPTPKTFTLLMDIPYIPLAELSSEISHAGLDPHVHAPLYHKLSEELARRGAISEAWKVAAACRTGAGENGCPVGHPESHILYEVASSCFGMYRVSDERFVEAMASFESMGDAKTRTTYAMAMRLLIARANQLKDTNYLEARRAILRAADLYDELRLRAGDTASASFSSSTTTSRPNGQHANSATGDQLQALFLRDARRRGHPTLSSSRDLPFSTDTVVRVVIGALLEELLALGEVEKARTLLLDRAGADPGWWVPSGDDHIDPRGGAARRHQQLYVSFIMRLGTHTPRHRNIAIELFSKLTHDFVDPVWPPAKGMVGSEKWSRAQANIGNVYSKMANIFLMQNDPWRARTLFEDINAKGLQKNSRLYATMIRGTTMESTSHIDVDRAEALFSEAMSTARQKNARFLHSLQRRMQLDEGGDDTCMLLHADPFLESVYHSMIRVYSRAGSIDAAVVLFDTLRKHLHHLGKLPSTFAYDVMIHGLGRYKRFDEARAYWDDLTNHAPVLPSARLYSTMMRVLVESGDPVSAVLLAGEMSARGMEPSIHTSIVLVYAKGQTGDHAGANELFLTTEGKLREKQQELKQLNDPHSYLRRKEYLDFLQSKLYVAIAKSCLRQGRFTEAKQLFVDGLSRIGAGTSGEQVLLLGMIEGLLREVIQRMVSQPPPKIKLKGERAPAGGVGGGGSGGGGGGSGGGGGNGGGSSGGGSSGSSQEAAILLELAEGLFEDVRRSGALNRKQHTASSVSNPSSKREQRNKLYNLMLQAHGAMGNVQKAQAIMKEMDFRGEDLVEGMHGLLDVFMSMGKAEEALELACDPRLEYGIQGRVRVLIGTGRIEDAIALAAENKSVLLRELGMIRDDDSDEEYEMFGRARKVDEWEPIGIKKDAAMAQCVDGKSHHLESQEAAAPPAAPAVPSSRQIALSEKAFNARHESRLEDALVNLLQQHSWKVVERLLRAVGLDPTPKSKRALFARLTNLVSGSTDRCSADEMLDAIRQVEDAGFPLSFKKGQRAPRGDTATLRRHLVDWFISESIEAHRRGNEEARNRHRLTAREMYNTLRRRGAFLHPSDMGSLGTTREESVERYGVFRSERPPWLRRAMSKVMKTGLSVEYASESWEGSRADEEWSWGAEEGGGEGEEDRGWGEEKIGENADAASDVNRGDYPAEDSWGAKYDRLDADAGSDSAEDDLEFEAYLAHRWEDEGGEENFEFEHDDGTVFVAEDWEENDDEPSINLMAPSKIVPKKPKDAAEEEASWW